MAPKHYTLCKPSTESSHGHVVTAVENSFVSEGGCNVVRVSSVQVKQVRRILQSFYYKNGEFVQWGMWLKIKGRSK